MKEATFEVPDMSCDHCKAAVEGELGKLPTVATNADVEKGIVEVHYDEGQVTVAKLMGAIENAGYRVDA